MARALLLVALLCGAAALAAAGAACGTRSASELLSAQAHTPARALLEGKKKIELGDKPGSRDTDGDCGEWKVGTATGYSTDGTDKGDLPMAPNDLGEYVVPGKFFKAHGVLAVDWSDWEDAKYKNVEVYMDGKFGTLQVWDFCNDKDCSKDNKECCSSNKKTYTDEDGSGYLLDIETHALKEFWDLDGAHNWLVAPAWYRVCKPFDMEAEVDEFEMVCKGVEGDGKCDYIGKAGAQADKPSDS